MGAMAAMLSASRAAEGGRHNPDHSGVDLAHIWRSLRGVGCALAPARGIFGIVRRSRRCASGHPKISDGGVGGPAGLALACDTLDLRGRVVGRVNGRPVSIGKENNLVCRRKSNHFSKGLSCRKWRSDLELADLPEDVLRIIFSKLQYSEVVRTSVLSSKWRRMWIISSRLSLDCTAIRGQCCYFRDKKRYTQQCIDIVNTVVRQFHGEVVEELEIRVEFHDMLVSHLDNWINFAVSSLTKNLALDLLPAEFIGKEDMYIFPIELFDSASISQLQHLQLSCVSFKPGSQFMSFRNLKKLDLQLFSVSRKDLEDMLAGCSTLTWLSLSRWCMEDELTVKKPLDHLMYLCIVDCSITKIVLQADNLKTFVYDGAPVTIDLGQVKQLETAQVNLNDTTLNYALTVLPNVLTCVKNFTLDTYLPLETPLLLDRICIFSQLKILQLLLLIDTSSTPNILSLVSFLRASPSIEELEVHFEMLAFMEGPGWGTLQRLRGSSYKYLRNVLLTGFHSVKGQLEFLVHIVENAPGLKVLTLDPTEKQVEKQVGRCFRSESEYVDMRAAARKYLDGKILPSTEVHIL